MTEKPDNLPLELLGQQYLELLRERGEFKEASLVLTLERVLIADFL